MIHSKFIHLAQLRHLFKNLATFAVSAQKAKSQKTLYQVLQLPSTAPQSNVRKNYLKLAKIFHPDVYKGSDKGRFEQIKKAYEVLSDLRKRQQYDEQIGLRKRSPEPTTQQFKGETQNAAADEVNKRNNFTYDTQKQEQVNIDEEYEKFFNKKKQTDFEEIRLHEQAEFRQMNEKERVRFRVRELFDKDMAQTKIRQTKAFEDMLDDQIGQRNVHHEDIQKTKQKLDKAYSEEGIKKKKIMVYVGAVFGVLVFYPLFFSFWTKYRLEKEQKQKLLDLMENMKIKAQEADIRSRFQY